VKTVRILGLCLAAVFALSAMVASAAQAAGPEWGRCVAQKKGEYTDANCQTKSAKAKKGSHEWVPGPAPSCVAQKKGEYVDSNCTTKSAKPKKGKFEKAGGPGFTSAGKEGILNTDFEFCVRGNYTAENCEGKPKSGEEFPLQVECKGESSSGVVSSATEVANVKVVFTGCDVFGTVPCNSAGAAEGEIRVNTLKGVLGYINKSTKSVGVDLKPASPGDFAKFVCSGTLQTTVGSGPGEVPGEPYYPETGGDGVISPITPINEMGMKSTQVYSTSGEENVPNKFEGGPRQSLEDWFENTENPPGSQTSAWSRAGQAITTVNTTASEMEIKA